MPAPRGTPRPPVILAGRGGRSRGGVYHTPPAAPPTDNHPRPPPSCPCARPLPSSQPPSRADAPPRPTADRARRARRCRVAASAGRPLPRPAPTRAPRPPRRHGRAAPVGGRLPPRPLCHWAPHHPPVAVGAVAAAAAAAAARWGARRRARPAPAGGRQVGGDARRPLPRLPPRVGPRARLVGNR